MINLSGANSAALQVVTAAAVALDVYASWVDYTSPSTFAPDATATAITTATTTSVVAAPASGTIRNVKSLYVRNKGAASQTVTVRVLSSAVAYEVRKVTLSPGDTLVYEEGGLNFEIVKEVGAVRSVTLADQSVPVALTAITGSSLDLANLKAGTVLRWRLKMTKTGAGIAAQTFDVRFGTAGTTADTVRLSGFTTGTQSANADVADVEVRAIIRAATSTGTVSAIFSLAHNLAATGFAPTANVIFQVTSAAFDLTVAGLKATLCTTPGASAVVTVQGCIAERIEP